MKKLIFGSKQNFAVDIIYCGAINKNALDALTFEMTRLISPVMSDRVLALTSQ